MCGHPKAEKPYNLYYRLQFPYAFSPAGATFLAASYSFIPRQRETGAGCGGKAYLPETTAGEKHIFTYILHFADFIFYIRPVCFLL